VTNARTFDVAPFVTGSNPDKFQIDEEARVFVDLDNPDGSND
jgi:hypothetical protein